MPEIYIGGEGERPFTERAEVNVKKALVGLSTDISARLNYDSIAIAAGHLDMKPAGLQHLVGSLEVDLANKLYWNSYLLTARRFAITAEALGASLQFGLQPHARPVPPEREAIRSRASGNISQAFERVVDQLHQALGYTDPMVPDEEVANRMLTFADVIRFQRNHAVKLVSWLEESRDVDARDKQQPKAYISLERLAVLSQTVGCDLVTSLEPKPQPPTA